MGYRGWWWSIQGSHKIASIVFAKRSRYDLYETLHRVANLLRLSNRVYSYVVWILILPDSYKPKQILSWGRVSRVRNRVLIKMKTCIQTAASGKILMKYWRCSTLTSEYFSDSRLAWLNTSGDGLSFRIEFDATWIYILIDHLASSFLSCMRLPTTSAEILRRSRKRGWSFGIAWQILTPIR